jgi:hypothetical protein
VAGCIFCGEGIATNEHVFSERWLEEVLGGGSDFHHRHERGSPTETSVRTWSKQNPDLKVRCVCKTCNSGWMSRMDNDVKEMATPMVLGYETHMTAAGARFFASWTFKTALVADHLQAQPVVEPQVAKRFYERPEAPDDVRVWVGYTEPPQPTAGVFNTAQTIFSSDVTSGVTVQAVGYSVDSNVYLCLGQVGHMLFLVLTLLREIPFDWHPNAASRIDYLCSVWPAEREVIWPPKKGVPFDKLPDFVMSAL